MTKEQFENSVAERAKRIRVRAVRDRMVKAAELFNAHHSTVDKQSLLDELKELTKMTEAL